jgi:hypothetical protein
MAFLHKFHLLVESGKFILLVVAIFEHGKDVGRKAAYEPNQTTIYFPFPL